MDRENFCKFAPDGAVMCEKRNCSKCGWNPKVAEARLEAIIAKMAEEEVSHGKGNTVW